MIRVYFASKLHHADRWRRLCAESKEFIAHARWLKHSTIGTPDTAEHARHFWLQDEQDVRDADAVVVFGGKGDHLRGALVEAGIAIACRIPVFVVGDHPDYGTWRHHPGVRMIAEITELTAALREITPRYERIGN